jgi:hypothetical protein
VQLDVGDGWGDDQRELPGSCHAFGMVRVVKANQRFDPLVVRHHPGSSYGGCHLSGQGPDIALGGNVLGAPEHDVECFVTLIVTGLRVGVAIEGLHLPLRLLECHLLILLLLWIHLLFVYLLGRRRAFMAPLLLLFVELFRELLDLLALTHAVARRVMHRASTTIVIAVEHLTGVLVASWTAAPTRYCSRNCGGTY